MVVVVGWGGEGRGGEGRGGGGEGRRGGGWVGGGRGWVGEGVGGGRGAVGVGFGQSAHRCAQGAVVQVDVRETLFLEMVVSALWCLWWRVLGLRQDLVHVGWHGA